MNGSREQRTIKRQKHVYWMNVFHSGYRHQKNLKNLQLRMYKYRKCLLVFNIVVRHKTYTFMYNICWSSCVHHASEEEEDVLSLYNRITFF